MQKAVETKARKIRVGKTEKTEKREQKKQKKEEEKKERMMEVKKIAEESEIWNKEEEAVKLEKEARKLVLEGSTSRFMSLARKPVKECLHRNYEIMLLKQRKDLC